MDSKDILASIFDVTSDVDIKLIEAIHKKHKDVFELAVELLRIGYESFPIGKKLLKKTVSEPVERCLLALYSQAFRLFRAQIVLNKSGLDTEAKILLRSLLDTASYILYISEKDHDDRLDLYTHSYALSQYTAVKEFIEENKGTESEINLRWYVEQREEALKYFRKKYGADMTKRDDRFKYGLRPNEAAKKITDTFYKEALGKYYKTFHRDVSMLCHAGDVLAFIKPGEEGKFILEITPRNKYIEAYLKVAIRFFFHVLLRLNELLGLGVTESVVVGLSEKIKKYDEE
jgi:hypothetical protein